MSSSQHRQYDIVLLGATGYTGRIVADAIHAILPKTTKWAIAGRNNSKLRAMRDRLVEKNRSGENGPIPDVEIVQLAQDQLNSIASKTRLILAVLGPYLQVGEPVIEACIASGTHYMDTCGETPWIKEMVEKHHRAAVQAHAMIIHSMGLVSVPADIATYLAVQTVRSAYSLPTSRVDMSYTELKTGFGGGSLHSMMMQLETYSLKQFRDCFRPFAMSPIKPKTTSSAPTTGLLSKIFGIHKPRGFTWQTYSAGIGPSDRQIVHRSWGLMAQNASADIAHYGENFDWHEWTAVSGPLPAFLIHVVTLTAIALLALVKPLRWVFSKLALAPGEGPSGEQIKGNRFEVKVLATADDDEHPNESAKVVRADMVYDDDPYLFAGVAVAVAATVILGTERTLAHQIGGGILTSATLGQPFIEGLRAQGVTLKAETVDSYAKKTE